MTYRLILLLIFGTPGAVLAQYFQYSQYNFASPRINPAMVAATNYATLGILHRQQGTGSDVNLKSSFVSGSYPFISRRSGLRWSGFGVSVMDDRAGAIFNTREAAVSYGVNVFLSRFQTLSLGFKGLYQKRSVNLDGLFTGSQYIPDRGFDQTLSNGENLAFLRSDFVTFSSGLYWQETDKEGGRVAYCGVSFFDFNKPKDSFSGVASQLNSTLIFNGGVRLYDNKILSLTPELLFTRSSSTNIVNAGAVTSYYLRPFPNQLAARIDLITKYVVGRSGIIGLQLHRETFSIGFSYDFPVVSRNVANVSAFEVGLEIRKLVDPRLKRKTVAKRKPSAQQQKPVGTPSGNQKGVKPQKPILSDNDSDSVGQTIPGKIDLKAVIQHKQDSILTGAQAGKINHEPVILEKVILHFNFEFNSTDLDAESTQYLDELSSVLRDNEHLRIRLTGHTDNVGSAKFNQRLSLYRANAIREFFIENGIDPYRIETDGKGLTEPLNENRTEEDRAKNRRVELLVLYGD